MEYPAAPNPEQLSTLLGQIISGQNSQELEKYFKRYLKLSQSIQDLMNQMVNNTNPQIRQLSSVLLRKKINKHWLSLNSDLQVQIKAALVNQITIEPEPLVRKNVASLAAALAINILQTWPELLGFINTCIDNESVPAREIGLYLLAELLENEDICKFLKPHQEKLLTLFARSLEDSSSREIRKCGLKALGNYVTCSEEEEVQYMIQLIPKIMAVVKECVEALDEELVVFAFDIFDELLDGGHNFGPNLEVVVRMAIEAVGGNPKLNLSTRECAMDFLETLGSSNPKILSGNPEVLRYLFQHIFTIATECEDDPEETTPVDMAFRLIDSLAIDLPNKSVYPIAIEFAKALISNPSPIHRKAGVITIGVIAEGCSDYMKQDLEAIVKQLISALYDADQSVREGAGLSLGYCSEHLKPDILELHEVILPRLIEIVDQPVTKVKQKVLYAIDIFCENFDEDVEKYLAGLVPKLISIAVQDGDAKSRQMAVSALSSAISSAEQKILPYFNQIIQLLNTLLNNPRETDLTLKATTIQCLGTLASSSTIEIFAPYLAYSIDMAFHCLSVETLELREAGFAFFYLLSRLLKEQMEPYIDKVVEEAIKTCEAREGLEVGEGESDESDEEEEEDESTYKVRTAFLDEKTAALHTLGHLSQACPGKILPFLPRITENIEILFDYFHENIRMQVVTTAQQIIQGLVKLNGGYSNAQEFWLLKVFHRYIEFISDDESKEVTIRVLEAIEELLHDVGSELIQDDYMKQLVEKFAILLSEQALCQREGDETEGDHDETLMGDLCDLLQELAKVYGERFSPYFETLLPGIAKFTKAERNPRDRTLFTGLLADTLKHMPSVAQKYSNDFSSLALLNLHSNEVSLYRNTLYYLGVICQQAPQLASNYPQYLQSVQAFFTQEFEPATVDNAVAAISRMIYTAPQALPLPQLLPVIFPKLPLKDDYSETSTVLKAIVFLFENNIIDMSSYLEKSLELIIEGLVVNAAEPDKYKLEISLLTSMRGIVNKVRETPVFVQVAQKLTPENQALLAQILQG
ncbi:unnamed protein product [Blepharisma stoltei]|uniref:Importin N-terminal domain-containing protein n=1 Tax=Blepharisma stoltei TaxID=1481888 RepID=A0AAU9IHW6_9CILI|nr:unnamed protein product [Blepharisma stoltei]